jgi:nitroreductase
MPDSLSPRIATEASSVNSPEALLAARHRTGGASQPTQWNAVLATILAHRSVRAYAPTALAEGTVETLIAAAQSAPTSSNLQTWSVIAVSDPARKAALSEVANGQRHILQAPVTLVWLADLNRLATLGAGRGQPVEGLDYLETFLVAVVDAALAAQNAVVAAESLGLGTVYIGALRNDPERVAAVLKLPSHVVAVFGLCLGYAAADDLSGIKPRLDQSVVLHREVYGAADNNPAIDAYDRAIQDFQSEQRISQVPWSRQALARVAGPKSLSGRDRIKGTLQRLGFKLL